MPHTPHLLHSQFVEAFNSGTIDELLSLYEPGAVLVPEPGKPVSGQVGIRAAISAFHALNGKLNMAPAEVIQSGDIALLLANWTLNGKVPDGSAVNLAGRTTDVARKQADGSWLFVIDSPFGGVSK